MGGRKENQCFLTLCHICAWDEDLSPKSEGKVGAERETTTKQAYKQKTDEDKTKPQIQVHFRIMAQFSARDQDLVLHYG